MKLGLVFLTCAACGGAVGTETAGALDAPDAASASVEASDDQPPRNYGGNPANPPSLEQRTAGGGPKPR